MLDVETVNGLPEVRSVPVPSAAAVHPVNV